MEMSSKNALAVMDDGDLDIASARLRLAVHLAGAVKNALRPLV